MRWFLFAAAGIVVYQVFIPPVVGLANQSDFKRVIGKFGYGPEPPEIQYAFISLKYIPDPSYRVKEWEQPSSEDLLVRLALLINRVVSKDGELDLRVMGLVHAAAFLAALAWLLVVTRELPAWPLIWIGVLLVTTDVGYVAYFNSFYAEPASYIFCLLLIAESIAICRRGVTTPRLLCWSVCAVLLVTAKPINAPLGLLLGVFAARLAWRSWAGWLGCAAILSAVVFSVATTPREMLDANAYNLVFLGLVPESNTPSADVVELGFDPGSDVLSGTGAWSPKTGYYTLRTSGVIPNKVTLFTVLRFFAAHPTRLWRHIRANLNAAMLLRPDLGNFDRSSGHAPLARSQAFSLWSSFHESVLRRVARPLFLLLLIPPLAALAWTIGGRAAPMYVEFLALLASCCLASFLTASFGDAWDMIKHMFLFNVLLDACLISAAALLWSQLRGYTRPRFRPVNRGLKATA